MHCLRWWLPIFLLPLPAASPVCLVLFVILYVIRTKPCAYCSMIILGLLFSTCSFYQYAALPLSNVSLLSPTQSSTAGEASAAAEVVFSSDSSTSTPSLLELAKSQSPAPTSDQRRRSPSSCWLDLNALGSSHAVDMSWWSAPISRRYPSVLGRAAQDTEDSDQSSSSSWPHLLRNGVFVGFNDVGFRLKLSLE